jgi:hypothetical protein
VANAVKGRLGVAPLHDHIEDPITVVTKKIGGSHRAWKLTRDIRVRFSSARSAKQAYEQNRGHYYKDTDTSRLLTYNGCVNLVIIPTGHLGDESDDPTLHKVFISCTHFKGKDNGALHALVKDNLAEQYEDLFLLPDDDFDIPEDLLTSSRQPWQKRKQ